MNERLRQLGSQLEALSTRERGLVLCGVIALMFAIWDFGIVQSLQSQRAELDATRLELEARARSLKESTDELRRSLASEPHAEKRDQERTLQAALRASSEDLRAIEAGLVSPAEMASLLQRLLASDPALAVTRIEALEPEPLFDRPTDAEPGDSLGRYFRHGMQIELEAQFFEALSFIREMERLPWTLFWDQLEYEVVEHPRAKITLVVHTLSRNEGWIGA